MVKITENIQLSLISQQQQTICQMSIPFHKWASINDLNDANEATTTLSKMRRDCLLFTKTWEAECIDVCATWGSLSLHSCLWRGGMADWAGGQCSPSVLPFTEYSGVLPSVMSRVRNTRNSSVSYSKNSSVASRQGREIDGQHVFSNHFTSKQKTRNQLEESSK